MVSWDAYLVGIVTLPVSCLQFPLPSDVDHLGRLEDERVAYRIANHFRQVGIKSEEPGNQIRGIIDGPNYQSIRDHLNLSADQLKQTLFQQIYPVVHGEYTVHCTDGRHRIEAAKLLRGTQATWTVRLHFFPHETVDRGILLHQEPKEHATETLYSDGEICRNAIIHFTQKRYALSRGWERVLSNSKQKCLAALLGHTEIMEAVSLLLPFAGLWPGLQLGNWLKHLATRCDELIIMYWHHIHKVWDTILGGRQDLKQLLDVTTVRKLQYRAPRASKTDRNEIKRSMLDGSLFRHVTSPSDREMIRKNMLEITTLIPSIESFHNNMIYISIGAKILKTHLSLDKTELDHGSPYRHNNSLLCFADVNVRRGTLFKDCLACFNQRQRPIFQVTETDFQPYEGQVSPSFAYLELFVAALRNFFPTLSADLPLRDSRNEAVSGQLNMSQISRFRWQAWNMGFHNKTTNTESRSEPEKEVRPKIHCSLSEWRGGKPYLRTFLDLKRHAFVASLYQNRLVTEGISPSFVFRAILDAFFGDIGHMADALVLSQRRPNEQSRSHPILSSSSSQEKSEIPKKPRADPSTEATSHSPDDVRARSPRKDLGPETDNSGQWEADPSTEATSHSPDDVRAGYPRKDLGPETDNSGQWEAEQHRFSIDNESDSRNTPPAMTARQVIRKRKRKPISLQDKDSGQETVPKKKRKQRISIDRLSFDKKQMKKVSAKRRGGINYYDMRRMERKNAMDRWIQFNGFPFHDPKASNYLKRKAGEAFETNHSTARDYKSGRDRVTPGDYRTTRDYRIAREFRRNLRKQDSIGRQPKMRKMDTAERPTTDIDFTTVVLSPVEPMANRRTPDTRPRPVESDNESARSA